MAAVLGLLYLLNDLVNPLPPLSTPDMFVHPDERLEGEMLPDCERPYEEVVLLNVGREGGEAGRGHHLVVGDARTCHL